MPAALVRAFGFAPVLVSRSMPLRLRQRALRAGLTAFVAGTAVLTLIGLLVSDPIPGPRTGAALPDGKNGDRLASVEEAVPGHETRILDTVAMFALPRADARSWSERPPGRSPQAAAPRSSLPRIAAAEASHDKPLPVLPPARPAAVASLDAKRAAANTPGDGEREPVRVFGWAVPGTKHLPTGRDAARVAEGVRDGAVTVASGAGRLVVGTASKAGGAIAGAGRAAGELLGLD